MTHSIKHTCTHTDGITHKKKLESCCLLVFVLVVADKAYTAQQLALCRLCTKYTHTKKGRENDSTCWLAYDTQRCRMAGLLMAENKREEDDEEGVKEEVENVCAIFEGVVTRAEGEAPGETRQHAHSAVETTVLNVDLQGAQLQIRLPPQYPVIPPMLSIRPAVWPRMVRGGSLRLCSMVTSWSSNTHARKRGFRDPLFHPSVLLCLRYATRCVRTSSSF